MNPEAGFSKQTMVFQRNNELALDSSPFAHNYFVPMDKLEQFSLPVSWLESQGQYNHQLLPPLHTEELRDTVPGPRLGISFIHSFIHSTNVYISRLWVEVLRKTKIIKL